MMGPWSAAPGGWRVAPWSHAVASATGTDPSPFTATPAGSSHQRPTGTEPYGCEADRGNPNRGVVGFRPPDAQASAPCHDLRAIAMSANRPVGIHLSATMIGRDHER